MAQAVPVKLRKQMLMMRAAVERVELAQHVMDVRAAATFSGVLRNALPGDRSRSVASRLFDLAKRYPFATSAASMVASQFKSPIIKFATKWGGIATLGYKLWTLWQHKQSGARAPAPRLTLSKDIRP